MVMEQECLCTSCCCSWKGHDGLTWYCCLLWSNLACSWYSFSYSSRAVKVIFVNSTLAQVHCSSALHAKHHCLKQLQFFNRVMPLSAAGEAEEHNCVGTACCTYNLDINSYGHAIDERIINNAQMVKQFSQIWIPWLAVFHNSWLGL